mmetsp:Transcript_17293/g.55464  ORF Transcript_17293/g.55464 Transcript_17293/m.55464 type:complete len:80 (+) Transcript_17293:619-858(+)
MFRAAGHVVTVETRGGYGAEPNRVANVYGSRSRPDITVQSFPYGAQETAIDGHLLLPAHLLPPRRVLQDRRQDCSTAGS